MCWNAWLIFSVTMCIICNRCKCAKKNLAFMFIMKNLWNPPLHEWQMRFCDGRRWILCKVCICYTICPHDDMENNVWAGMISCLYYVTKEIYTIMTLKMEHIRFVLTKNQLFDSLHGIVNPHWRQYRWSPHIDSKYVSLALGSFWW